jgi:predicted transcriptional regulator
MEKVFEALKLSPREIKVLKHLMKHDQRSSLDIQQAESLQQPEVSMATKDLLEKRYIKADIITVDTKNNGRRAMLYSITDDLYSIMAEQLKKMVADLLDKSDLYASLIVELEGMKDKEKTE